MVATNSSLRCVEVIGISHISLITIQKYLINTSMEIPVFLELFIPVFR
jgi:hypothetical protein